MYALQPHKLHGRIGPASSFKAQRLLTVTHAKKAAKQNKKQKKKEPVNRRIVIDNDFEDYEDSTTSRPPSAPSPVAAKRQQMQQIQEPGPGDYYKVFAEQEQVRKAKWSWDEEGSSSAAEEEPPMPQWNPKTGFMKTRAQVEAEQQAAAAAAAAAAAQQQEQRGAAAATATAAAAAAAGSDAAGSGELLPVGRGQVLSSCASTSFWMTMVALFMRSYAERNAPAVLGTDPAVLRMLLDFPQGGLESFENVAIVLGLVALVTGARYQLCEVWKEFGIATYRSNKQVLTPLGWPDVLLVACLTGLSEELLFRGALIPASLPDWRGVLLSAAIFGVLHNSGGRNLSFAAWAGGVGALYGAAYLATGNIWVPAAAHALNNFASAAIWITRYRGKPDEELL